jgi:hypothetical protein
MREIHDIGSRGRMADKYWPIEILSLDKVFHRRQI